MKKDFQQNDIKIENNEEGSAEENKLKKIRPKLQKKQKAQKSTNQQITLKNEH